MFDIGSLSCPSVWDWDHCRKWVSVLPKNTTETSSCENPIKILWFFFRHYAIVYVTNEKKKCSMIW